MGLGIAAAAATPILTLGARAAGPQDASAPAAAPHAGKIIDFRVRPPIPAYQAQNKLVNIPENGIKPSMFQVGKDEGLSLLEKEMDEQKWRGLLPSRRGKDMKLAVAILVVGFLYHGTALAHQSTKAKQRAIKNTCYSMLGDQKVCFDKGAVTWFFNGVSIN